MKGDKLRIALIFGGRSAEHEVSLRSARSIFEALDKEKYHVIPVLITTDGAWYTRPAEASSFDSGTNLIEGDRLIVSPDPSHKGFLHVLDGGRVEPMAVDAVFPALHGTFGEDGTVQGLLEMANLAYVGCGVLASAVGMDKVIMKAAFRDMGLNVGPFFWFLRSEWRQDPQQILEKLRSSRFPVFIKPANLGSSVGISRVTDPSDFQEAVDLAASYDRKILVEDSIGGRELEVSVLGNDNPVASKPGEVIAHGNFYDYDEKYLRDTTEFKIPAELPPDIMESAGRAAVTAFRAVDGSGLARVDLFLTEDNRIIVNEINTLPGFTSISMYPKLWEVSGLSYSQLLDRLVELALERHRDRQNIQTSRN
ncbi:MAG TPA: D-alanine--D-alanine ligase family protein [Desulfomonilaceae bacterium]|nr:D-alanine--D-alanine ligase family protein [Desulfomonilaceae bacterium]